MIPNTKSAIVLSPLKIKKNKRHFRYCKVQYVVDRFTVYLWCKSTNVEQMVKVGSARSVPFSRYFRYCVMFGLSLLKATGQSSTDSI